MNSSCIQCNSKHFLLQRYWNSHHPAHKLNHLHYKDNSLGGVSGQQSWGSGKWILQVSLCPS